MIFKLGNVELRNNQKISELKRISKNYRVQKYSINMRNKNGRPEQSSTQNEK